MFQKTRLRNLTLEQIILHGQTTRNQIAEASGIRLATIIEAVRSLLKQGIIIEPERCGKASVGRRPSPLCLNPELGRFWGISLNPDRIRVLLVDAAGTILHQTSSRRTLPGDANAIFQLIQDLTSEVLQQCESTNKAPILAAGFADPGLTDERDGTSLRAVNLPYWTNIPTAKKLEELLNCPAWVRPEMSARAYAERLHLPIHQEAGCFHLNVDKGVGGAYTRGADVFAGDSYSQMEIGHLVVSEDGSLCSCGNRGCLEAYAGREGMIRRVNQLRHEGVYSSLTYHDYSPEYFIQCVEQGDKAALRLAIETAQYIGKALSAAASLLNPHTICLSGPIFTLQETLLPVMRQALTLRCLPHALQGLEWHQSSLGPEAPALGAALIARHAILNRYADLP